MLFRSPRVGKKGTDGSFVYSILGAYGLKSDSY